MAWKDFLVIVAVKTTIVGAGVSAKPSINLNEDLHND